LFGALLKAGSLVRPVLPGSLRAKMPAQTRAAGPWPQARHARRMLVLDGCVQPALAPDINAAAARYLDSVGISLIKAPEAGCCGAVGLHTSDHAGGVAAARRNVDAWWPLVEQGVEAIVMTASGCGVVVADYAELLAHEPAYAERARQISALTRDLSAVVAENPPLTPTANGERVAFHPPCTLQHGQKTTGVVEQILRQAGYEPVPIRDSHLCCGSAGTYSILQSELSAELRERKVAALEENNPQMIASANIGCLTHIESATDIPVRHWIELVAPANS